MNRVNVLNQELFLEQFNKFIVLDRKSYLDFIRVLTSINNKESKEKISINGMELNEKNTNAVTTWSNLKHLENSSRF